MQHLGGEHTFIGRHIGRLRAARAGRAGRPRRGREASPRSLPSPRPGWRRCRPACGRICPPRYARSVIASMSWTVMRTRSPILRTLPSTRYWAPSFSATSRTLTGLVLVDEGRVARDDQQFVEARKLRDDVFGQSVGEEFLLGIAAHVVEGQHGDRGLGTVRIVHRGLRRWKRPARLLVEADAVESGPAG